MEQNVINQNGYDDFENLNENLDLFLPSTTSTSSVPPTKLDNNPAPPALPSSPPKIMVTSYSPDWEPQVVEDLTPNESSYISPTSSEFGNSYVTAEDNTPAYNLNNDQRNSRFSKLNGGSFNGSSEDKGSSSSFGPSSSVDLSLSESFSPSTDEGSNKTRSSMSVSPSTENESSSVSLITPTKTDTSNETGTSPLSMSCSPEVIPSVRITSASPGKVLNELSSPNSAANSFQKDSSDAFGESDEEYFEEYHLPNTHENAFVRHLSFRRKVQTTPINAPDAERIEGLVRTGEFIRHGSIRKKILPEEEELEEQCEDEEGEEEEESYNLSSSIEKEFRVIDSYLNESRPEEPAEESKNDDECLDDTPTRPKRLKRTTSTPKTDSESERKSVDENENCSNLLEQNSDISASVEVFEENLSIEDSTLRKIQECLDFSSYKDLLNLSGKLTDMLSPKEVEDVLINSERYRRYLDSEVFEALSLSFQGQTQSLPCNINSKLQSKSESSVNNSNEESNLNKSNVGNKISSEAPEIGKAVITANSQVSSNENLNPKPMNSTTCDAVGAQTTSLETRGSTNTLKKIPAPKFDLDWSSEILISDKDNSEGLESNISIDNTPPRKIISINRDILEVSEDLSYDLDVDTATEANEGMTDTKFREERNSPITTDSSILPPEISQQPPQPPDLIPELTSAEEFSEVRHWRNVVIGGAWRRIDMKAIAPYRKSISHGGYTEESQSPIVVLSAALLPEKSRKDYHYIMDNLFMYVLSFVEQLAADDYVLVYFSGGTLNGSGPGFHWMRRAYEMIDRRLRKNLKSLLIVHPSLWSRTIMTLSRPFISSKFYRKLKFVPNLTSLAQLVPLEQLEIPDLVKHADFQIMIKERKRVKR